MQVGGGLGVAKFSTSVRFTPSAHRKVDHVIPLSLHK